MAEMTKLGEATRDFVAAYDERTRTFNVLRSLTLDDEARKEAVENYKAANRAFEAAKAALLK